MSYKKWAAAVVLTMVLGLADCCGGTIFESADSSAPAGGGIVIAPYQYVGVRFQITGAVTVKGMGGYLGAANQSDSSLFAAIVALPSPTAFPINGLPLSHANLLAVATIQSAPSPAMDVLVPIGPVALQAGWYAMVFGSGDFGADGTSFAPTGNVPVDHPSYFESAIRYDGIQDVNNTPRNEPTLNSRFVISDATPAPEPASIGMLVVAVAFYGRRVRRRKLPCNVGFDSPKPVP